MQIIPIAIHCVAEEGSDDPKQSHTTIAVVEKHSDGSYVLKALKQKLFVDGLCYLLQEIYGVENKNTEDAKVIPRPLVTSSLKESLSLNHHSILKFILKFLHYSKEVTKIQKITVPNV